MTSALISRQGRVLVGLAEQGPFRMAVAQNFAGQCGGEDHQKCIHSPKHCSFPFNRSDQGVLDTGERRRENER